MGVKSVQLANHLPWLRSSTPKRIIFRAPVPHNPVHDIVVELILTGYLGTLVPSTLKKLNNICVHLSSSRELPVYSTVMHAIGPWPEGPLTPSTWVPLPWSSGGSHYKGVRNSKSACLHCLHFRPKTWKTNVIEIDIELTSFHCRGEVSAMCPTPPAIFKVSFAKIVQGNGNNCSLWEKKERNTRCLSWLWLLWLPPLLFLFSANLVIRFHFE